VSKYIDIVFATAGGPDKRFVEVEDDAGRGVSIGTWVDVERGHKALRLTRADLEAWLTGSDGT
jgi:hypothetical protein